MINIRSLFVCFVLSGCLIVFTGCQSNNQPVDQDTCPHTQVVFDKEKEPTATSSGYTEGHHCKRCGKILDGHDTLTYGRLTLNNSSNFGISGGVFSFKQNSISFKGGYASRASNFITLNRRGTFTNVSPVYKIKNLLFELSTASADAYITLGTDALPLTNESKLNTTHYQNTFNEHFRYFLISNHGDNAVTISNLQITFFLLEKGEKDIKLPNISINTNGVVIDSTETYVSSMISVTNPEDNTHDIKNAAADIRLRGSSTAAAPKKPYRIKFDKKQSVFGLTKAKSWVLLAEWYDATSLHNYLAQKIVGMFNNPKWVFHPIHVTVTLNDQYQGLYVLMEQPDEKEGRLNISQTITSGMELDKINYLIEQDGRAAQSGVENIDYINVRHNNNDTYYEIKYPEIDEFPDYDKNSNTSTMFNNFVSYLKQSLTDAWMAMDSRNLTTIQQIFDLDSIYNQSLLDVFVDERDHSWLSIKMFKDSSGKINFGPCWDYDSTSWGYVWADTYNKDPFRNHPTATHHASNEWLAVVTNQIAESKTEFKDRFINFYTSNLNRIKELFFEEESYISLEMVKDGTMWKDNNISILYENLRYLKYFLDTRYQEVVSHI